MYHPYFRGKQFELITIRESAAVLAKAKFVPIIEPVKEALNGLQRTIQAVCDAEGSAVIVMNPYHGDHAEGGAGISGLLAASFATCDNIAAGILLKEDMSVAQAMHLYNQHAGHQRVLIHSGFSDPKALADQLGDDRTELKHVFFQSCGLRYRKHFQGATRVLLRDGFERRKNREYPELERFSDLHITYPDEGCDGFGDFLIVGDDYSETGGPAYAVAIHLTFIDPTKDDDMFIYHFVSETQDTPADPAGKFGEAVASLMAKLATPDHHLFESTAIAEFRDLAARGHFPGLGYIKKLAMKHHVETLAAYLE
jgi:hypothetical protein